jgi:hypothetical protein
MRLSTAAPWIVSAPVSGKAGFKSLLSKDIQHRSQEVIYRGLKKLFQTKFYGVYAIINPLQHTRILIK